MGDAQDKLQERRFWNSQYSQRVHVDHRIDVDDFREVVPEYEGGTHRGQMRKMAFELLGPVSGLSVLDYACGDGRYGVYLALQGACVTGFDISDEGIRIARLKAQANNVNVRHAVMDSAALGFRDNSFDLVVGVAALHHVHKYQGTRDELRRIMRPGGRAVFVENLDSPLSKPIRELVTMRSVADDAGETVLTYDDLEVFGRPFASARFRELSLLFMIKRFLKRYYQVRVIQHLLRWAWITDESLLRSFPRLRPYAGEIIVELTK